MIRLSFSEISSCKEKCHFLSFNYVCLTRAIGPLTRASSLTYPKLGRCAVVSDGRWVSDFLLFTITDLRISWKESRSLGHREFRPPFRTPHTVNTKLWHLISREPLQVSTSNKMSHQWHSFLWVYSLVCKKNLQSFQAYFVMNVFTVEVHIRKSSHHFWLIP